MSQIDTVREKLGTIREQLNEGKVFQSSGEKVGRVLQAIKETEVTPLYLPDDDAEALDRIQELIAKLAKDELTFITDED